MAVVVSRGPAIALEDGDGEVREDLFMVTPWTSQPHRLFGCPGRFPADDTIRRPRCLLTGQALGLC